MGHASILVQIPLLHISRLLITAPPIVAAAASSTGSTVTLVP
ncbi:hypothetical protein [Agreia pratensis]|nr:hypothetical protein [Agreia pratensis]